MTSNTHWLTSILTFLPFAIAAIGIIHVGVNLLIRIQDPHITPAKMLSRTAFANTFGTIGIFGAVAALCLLADAGFTAALDNQIAVWILDVITLVVIATLGAVTLNHWLSRHAAAPSKR